MKQRKNTTNPSETQSSDALSPASSTRRLKKEQAQDALWVATVAAQLVGSGRSDFHDPRKLADSVALARRILKQASNASPEWAYELFPPDGVFDMRGIAETFKEADWNDLKSHNTVTKLVRELLDLMHRDIQIRKTIISSAFRCESLIVDAEEAERKVVTRIKSLAHDLGMDIAIGETLEDLASKFWQDLVESWLHGKSELIERLSNYATASPSLFSSICSNSSYEKYLESRVMSKNLKADDLLCVILWMNSHLRTQVAEETNRQKGIEILSRLNLWPEFLGSKSRNIAHPFAELLDNLSVGIIDEANLLEKFDLGIDRFSHVLGCLMLIEFSSKIDSQRCSEVIQELKKRWSDLKPAEKADFAEMILGDPWQVFEAISSFLRSEMPYFPSGVRLPFHGAHASPQLRPYVKNLEMLLHSIREANQMAHQLGKCNGFQDLEDLVRAEKDHMLEVSKCLAKSDCPSTQEKIAKGAELVNTSIPDFNPGHVNAHLLFRFAAEMGYKEAKLVRH